MNNTELRGLIKVCSQDLTDAGLVLPKVPTTYRIATRMTKNLGLCSVARNRYTGLTTKIIISLSKDLTVDIAKDTLMHEMLHAVDECKSGHTGRWAQLASMMSRRGYHITVKATQEEVVVLNQVRLAKGGYLAKCNRCGGETIVTARHAIVEHPERYHCKKCGGSFTVSKG